MITDLSQEAGKAVAQIIDGMSVKPDGIFISNDICAVSCMQSLKENGYVIPDDIAVVRFNNDPISEVILPNLTTVYYPGKQMGEIAVRSMVDHLKRNREIDVLSKTVLQSEIIVRGSSLKTGKSYC